MEVGVRRGWEIKGQQMNRALLTFSGSLCQSQFSLLNSVTVGHQLLELTFASVASLIASTTTRGSKSDTERDGMAFFFLSPMWLSGLKAPTN